MDNSVGKPLRCASARRHYHDLPLKRDVLDSGPSLDPQLELCGFAQHVGKKKSRRMYPRTIQAGDVRRSDNSLAKTQRIPIKEACPASETCVKSGSQESRYTHTHTSAGNGKPRKPWFPQIPMKIPGPSTVASLAMNIGKACAAATDNGRRRVYNHKQGGT